MGELVPVDVVVVAEELLSINFSKTLGFGLGLDLDLVFNSDLGFIPTIVVVVVLSTRAHS